MLQFWPGCRRIQLSGERFMASGKVKWWNDKHGFGFIAGETGQDVFVHHKDIVGRGFKTLHEGDEVVFDIVSSEKGPRAENVQRVDPT
jgi:CspA family cold shock protein